MADLYVFQLEEGPGDAALGVDVLIAEFHNIDVSIPEHSSDVLARDASGAVVAKLHVWGDFDALTLEDGVLTIDDCVLIHPTWQPSPQAVAARRSMQEVIDSGDLLRELPREVIDDSQPHGKWVVHLGW